MQTFKYSLYKFTDLENAGFDSKDYSKLKYGSKRVARIFGVDLGNRFLKDLILGNNISSNTGYDLYNKLINKEIVIASAPYKFIPVASTILKDYFLSAFNTKWAENNPSVQDLKVFRGHSYNADYGSMTEEQRDKAINSDDFYIDANFIKGKTLFFIDDVRITGAHERRIEKLLESVGFDGDVVFLYFAEFVGKSHPNIENELNFAFVKDLKSINYIIQNDDFIFNTRVTKYILSASKDEFNSFIDYQTKSFRNTLLTYTMGNEYHHIDPFKENISYLKSRL